MMQEPFWCHVSHREAENGCQLSLAPFVKTYLGQSSHVEHRQLKRNLITLSPLRVCSARDTRADSELPMRPEVL